MWLIIILFLILLVSLILLFLKLKNFKKHKENIKAANLAFDQNDLKLFEFIDQANDEVLINLLKTSKPKIQETILKYLNIERIANILNKTDLNNIEAIAQALFNIYLTDIQASCQISSEQVSELALILEIINPICRNTILNFLEEKDKRINLKLKELILAFDDLINLPDQDFKRVLFEIKDLKNLALALKKCKLELKEKILNNLSDRVKIILDEEILTLSDEELDLDDIETAQSEILRISRKLERERKIQAIIKKIKSES